MGKDRTQENEVKIDVIIPVYKPDSSFQKLIENLMCQSVLPHRIFLLQTIEAEGDELFSFEEERVQVYPILKKDFDHGATRHYGASLSQSDYLLFMTQDAMPADDLLIEHLLAPFQENKTGIAYARQLAREGADILERLARQHNYPEQDQMKSAADLERLGIKTYFSSDVCAMYRRDIYEALGGFVYPTIFNEDMIMASAVIGAGYQVAYCAKAEVVHSHSYTCMQQFHRNFDLGVSQRQYHQVFDSISSEKEGAGFAKKTVSYLLKKGKLWKAFYFVIQCAFKLFGYQLGKRYDKLPRRFVLACTMSPSYWKEETSYEKSSIK